MEENDITQTDTAAQDRLERLAEKRKKLRKSSVNLMEAKALRKVLVNLGTIATSLGVMPHDCRVSIEMFENGDARILVRNRKNRHFHDFTPKAEEMKDQHPFMGEMIEDFLDIVKDMAEYWNLGKHEVHFVTWLQGKDLTAEDLKKMKLRCIVKPKRSRDLTERIILR